MKIYLDNCCYNRPFDDQSQVKIRIETESILSIQEKIINKNYELVWSYMIDYENNFNPYPERRISIENWKEYSQIDITESKELLILAKEIFELGIKSRIHCILQRQLPVIVNTLLLLMKTW